MSKINLIQNAIKTLDGGEYQKFLDSYLYKKYHFSNIVPLGSKDGSNKTTKGIPDSYVLNKNGKYILIMYGTVERDSYKKVRKDLLDSYNRDKTELNEDDISKIICCHTSSNITTSQNQELLNLIDNIEIELIGIGTLSFDIFTHYSSLAKEFLSVAIDSGQISNIDDFLSRYDSNSVNAPISIKYIERAESEEIAHSLENNLVVLVTGKPGIGKTKISIEVCKKYLTKHSDTTCLCVRNNGNDIYEDIKDYTSEDSKYLIFVDDINEMRQLNSFMDYITINNIKDFKIIATIRDYVIQNTISKISEYTEPYICALNIMSDDKIKEILESEYNIKNSKYQEHILKISNGNPRIAVMSAEYIKNGKIKNLNSVVDVFKNFYGVVINDNKITETQFKTLFYISLLGPLRIDNDDTKNMLEQLEIFSIDNFKELRKLELIDFYENSALKVCDQNFSNYIVYKYLMEDKNISLQELLKFMYPKLVSRFIETINMINDIFYSTDNSNYIMNEINSLWEEEPYNSDSSFLEYFHNVNIIKTLSILKNEINLEQKVSYSSEYLTIDKLNNHNCSNNKINIILSFKDLEYESSALDLLFDYFEKRPDLFLDFASGILTNWKINERSSDRDFDGEKILLNKLKDRYNENNKFKDMYAFILIKMIEEYLQVEIHCSRPGRNKFTIVYLTINLLASEKLFKFRHLLFDLVIMLIDNKSSYYKSCDLLLQTHYWTKDTNLKRILEDDCDYLDNNLFSKWTKPNLIESKVLRHYEKICNKLKIDKFKSLKNYLNNNNYKLLIDIEEDYDYDDIDKEENDHKEKINKLVNDFDLKDYRTLFQTCAELKDKNIKTNDWKITNSLSMIFTKLLEEDVNKFLSIFKIYAQSKYPFMVYPSFFSLINETKIEHLIEIVEEIKDNKSYYYLKFIYQNYVNKNHIKKVKSFLDDQNTNDNIFTLDINSICYYSKYDQNILDEYSNKVIKIDNINVISNYMNIDAYSRKDTKIIKNIVNSFNDKSILEELYLKTIQCSLDYNGLFAYKIIEHDISFLKRLIDNNHNFSISTSRFENIVQELWKSKDYNKYISYAFECFMESNFGYLDIHKLFENDSDRQVEKRQDEWIKKYIDKNYKDNDKIEKIFMVIAEKNAFKRKEYILYLLKINNAIELFKSIYLFSHSESWSGSRIPLIEAKIDFLKELKEELHGIDYIDHIRYLNELINAYEMQIKETKLKEYTDDFFR